MDFCSSGASGSGSLSVKGNFSHTGGSILSSGSGTANIINIIGNASQTIESTGFNTPHTIEFIVAPTGSGQVEIQSAKSFTVNPSADFTISNTSSATELVVNGALYAGSSIINDGATAINGTFQINDSGSLSSNAMTYGSSSTLIYNTSSPFNVSTEWSGNSTSSGLGVPQDVVIQNTNVVSMPTADRGLAGDITVASGGLILNATSGNLNVAGDWIRTGGSFTPNNRKVMMNGGTPQIVGGSVATSFFDLEIANTGGGVSLGAPIDIDGTLTLTTGILTTDATNILSLNNTSSSAINAGSSSKFIKGPMQWALGIGTYLFPVGKSTSNYFPFTLNVSVASSPVVTVEAFDADVDGSATFDGSLTGISHTEYWKSMLDVGTFTGSVSLTRITALGVEDIIGKSTSQGGDYSAIGGLPSSPSILGSDDISSLGYFVMATGTRKCPESSMVTPSSDQQVCQDVPTNELTADITNGSGIGDPTLQYQWYYNLSNSNTIAGATTIGGATTQSFTPPSGVLEAGTTRYYFCVGYASDNTCSQDDATQFLASNTVKVTVDNLPVCTIAGVDEVCPSTSGTIFSAPGGLSYSWSISGDGTTVGSLSNQMVTVDASAECSTSYILNLSVTDGNTCNSTCMKPVQVIDNIAPVLSGQPYAGTAGNNACKIDAELVAPFSAANAIDGYTDNCSGSVTAELTNTSVSGDDCNWSVTYTFTIRDVCGNELMNQSYSNSGSNQEAPTLTGSPYSGTSGTNACKNDAATSAPFNATNAIIGYSAECGGAVTAELTNTAITGDDCDWTVTYTFNVKDVCNNILGSQTYYNTGSDQSAPTWTTPANALDITKQCSDATGITAAQAMFPVASDNCDSDVSNIVKTSGTFVAGSCPEAGSYTNTWVVTDACGNTSEVYTQVITIIDTEAPTWTTVANALDITKQCSDATGITAAQAMFPVASDNCDSDVSNIVKTSGSFVAGSCPEAGSYTNTWVVTDACGNTSEVYTQVITIIDTEAPTWTTAANALDITKQCSDATGITAAQAMFPVASDNCDGDVSNIVKTSGAFVAGSCPEAGSYTNTWVVTDACGNTSEVYTQVITIIDTEAPTWTTAANALDVTEQCSDARQ